MRRGTVWCPLDRPLESQGGGTESELAAGQAAKTSAQPWPLPPSSSAVWPLRSPHDLCRPQEGSGAPSPWGAEAVLEGGRVREGRQIQGMTQGMGRTRISEGVWTPWAWACKVTREA